MLEEAIRKSEKAVERVLLMLLLSTIAVLGLVWLSIAVWGWIALSVSQPLAATITGGIFVATPLLAYIVIRSLRGESASSAKESDKEKKAPSDDVVARGMQLAERMAPDSPMAALLVALLAGLGSVSFPAALNPFLIKIMDDVENLPDGRARN